MAAVLAGLLAAAAALPACARPTQEFEPGSLDDVFSLLQVHSAAVPIATSAQSTNSDAPIERRAPNPPEMTADLTFQKLHESLEAAEGGGENGGGGGHRKHSRYLVPVDDNDSSSETGCIGTTEPFDMYLPSFDKTITIPPIPTELHLFSYATEDAMVAIPPACVTMYQTSLNKSTSLEDQPPFGPTGMAYARASQIEGKYRTLASMLETCACGMVLSLGGTGGVDWDTVATSAMLSGFGFLVVMPNSQAMPDDLHLKGRRPLRPLGKVDTSNFCGEYSSYYGICKNFNKPFCYTTKAENILENGDKYRAYVQRMYQIRIRELDYFMESPEGKSLVDKAKLLYLMGNSEGAQPARIYHNEVLDAKMSGRIIMSGTCDYNYFTPCPNARHVCGHKCRKDVPQLNIIGIKDVFFGRQNLEEGFMSMSSAVADEKITGYGGPITGSCREEYDSYGFTNATVVMVRGAGHGVLYWNSNLLRSVLADFVNVHKGKPSQESLNDFECTIGESLIYSCASSDPKTCTANYTVDPAVPWVFGGASAFGCPAAEAAA